MGKIIDKEVIYILYKLNSDDIDFCNKCLKITNYWYTPNGNEYCENCNNMKG